MKGYKHHLSACPEIVLFALLLFTGGQQAVSAQIIIPDGDGTVYVDHQADGDGSSWGNAAKSLIRVLNAASWEDSGIRTVRIAQGTYYPSESEGFVLRFSPFRIKRGGLKLYGGYNAATGQRNIAAFPTVLSGNIDDPASSADNSFNVLTIEALTEDADSVVVDGFTIRDAVADDPVWRGHSGGGVIVSNCTNDGKVVIRNCVITNNTATDGGGGAMVVNSIVNWIDCEFTENKASYGGALYDVEMSGNSIISGCKFLSNESELVGGAVFLYKSFPGFTIRDTRFEKNKSGLGGALYTNEGPSQKIISCSFRGNEAAEYGGGAYLRNCQSPLVANSLFSGNYSGNQASALLIEAGSDSRIANSTFAANYAVTNTTVGAANNASVDVSNSLILFNGTGAGTLPSVGLDNTSSFTLSYSACQGVLSGEGFFDWRWALPSAFKDIPDFNTAPTTAGDYRPVVKAMSGINRGNNSLVPTDITTDLGGRPRIRGELVDLGAYENQGLPNNLFEVYADVNAGSAGTGASWEDAAPGLKEALAIAEEGPHVHTVHVAGGTYYPTRGTDRDEAFVLPPRNIKLLGGYDASTGMRNPAEFPTVLSGNIGNPDSRDDNSYHVVVIAGPGADSTIVDGVRISHGNANGDGTFAYNRVETYRNWGGGGFVTNDAGTGKVVFRNCVISGNSAAAYGGGICDYNASLMVVNSAFYGNRADFGGGLSHVPGPGNTISPVVTQCTFAGNYAGSRGGGIDNFANSSLSLANTLIYGNGTGMGGVTNTGLGGNPAMTYTAQYSLIQGRAGGIDGNLDGTVDYPEMFAGDFHFGNAPTTDGSYSLVRKSPVVDKGSNALASGIAADLASKHRIVEGQVDIGAYEFVCTENYTLLSDGVPVAAGIQQGQTVSVKRHCEQVGTLQSLLYTGYTGVVTVQTWLAESIIQHGAARYVPRYHAISALPVVSSELFVTLYYSNSDFKTYNIAYGNEHNAQLPDIDDETPVTGNLRVMQYHGTGSGNGLPGTYPGERVLLPAHVSWDATLQVWKVTFQTFGFSGFFVTGQGNAALPVTLLTFEAQKQEDVVQLTWKTSVEKDFSHFEVERSTDARQWTAIGTRKQSQPGNTYVFTDSRPVPGIIYYRLKMVDVDGTFSYSPVGSVPGESSPEMLNTYPNPSRRGIVKLEVNRVAPTGIEVYDLVGRRTGIQAVAEGKGAYGLNFGNAAPGIYTIVVTHDLGTITRKHVVLD